MDKETGATWALVKFPPGPADAYHIHPNANQLVHRVTGPDGGKGVGITVKGERHGGAVFEHETIILMFWDGPSDTVVVE